MATRADADRIFLMVMQARTSNKKIDIILEALSSSQYELPRCRENHVPIPDGSWGVIDYKGILHSRIECIYLSSMHHGLEIPDFPLVKLSSKATHVCSVCKSLWTIGGTIGKEMSLIAGCTHPFMNLAPIKK